MIEAGMDPLQKDVGNTYEILTDQETSSGDRVEVRNRLEWNGIDVDALESDFVTHQVIHTYLRKYRGVERTESDTVPRERESVRPSSASRGGRKRSPKARLSGWPRRMNSNWTPLMSSSISRSSVASAEPSIK